MRALKLYSIKDRSVKGCPGDEETQFRVCGRDLLNVSSNLKRDYPFIDNSDYKLCHKKATRPVVTLLESYDVVTYST